MCSHSWLDLLTLTLRSPKATAGTSGVISERDRLTQRSCNMLFSNWVRTSNLERLWRYNENSNVLWIYFFFYYHYLLFFFISRHSPPFIGWDLYFSISLFHFHLYWFCIYSQPLVIAEEISYTDRLINLEVFTAALMMRENIFMDLVTGRFHAKWLTVGFIKDNVTVITHHSDITLSKKY